MSRTSVFTSITALPSGITRQSVLDTYHNHVEMIELNPLVVERFQCKPPSYSPEEELNSTWYTIKDKVSYLPGGFATGSVSYHACFHNLAEGLQTHVYAPLGLDIRAKWTVGGSLPGEPKEAVELGIKAPATGLYIREDVRMKCNIMMMGFVKKTFKESHAKLVDRLVEKAHIMESEAANLRLKMLKELAPGDRMGHGSIFIAPPPGYQEEQNEQNKHQQHYQMEHERRDSAAPPQYLPAQSYANHQSIYSNGSSSQSPVTSPGSSHASTNISSSHNGSSFLTSPPTSSKRLSNHSHSHSEDCGHLHFDPSRHHQQYQQQQQGQRETLTEQELLEQQITYLLPPTKYNPFNNDDDNQSPTSTAPGERLNPLSAHPPTPAPASAPKYSLLPAVAYNPHAQVQRSASQSRPRAQTDGSVLHAYRGSLNEMSGPPVPPKNNVPFELPA